MLKFILVMLIPLGILIYTIQFGRWMQAKKLPAAAVSAYVLGICAFGLSGVVLWRLFT